ncbi:MAG: hypothetical protein LLF98_12875 [Clostridium sp.]|nr:hypothetical protein [Clostridium sp.]MCE5222107.1 hypothetical protein [Clostridium sp.]
MGKMISISKVSELTGVTVKTLKMEEKSIKELSIEGGENSKNNTESNIDK